MRVIDSHTEGEPTRLVIDGAPDLGTGTMAERRARFARDHDRVRGFVVNEPRGYDALVGALLLPPTDPTCVAGAIFFNNVGVLGMCGHATIGLAATLAYLGRIGIGAYRLETPVGIVTFELLDSHAARIENVVSRRARQGVAVEAPGLGRVRGDIAWGGNWFFLCEDSPYPIDMANIAPLTQAGLALQRALLEQGFRGDDGGVIDHIEFFGPPRAPDADGRSFVLCPGGAYDRSPCGTGTSAKLACLAADGKLEPGRAWVQESVIGSRFVASYRPAPGGVTPSILGRAYVTADARLVRDPDDPFADGVRGG